MLVQSNESSCENNNELNQLRCISTYKMGQIGITKLIEEPYKSSINTENNLSTNHPQIIKIPSNTNSNTNTNNTNSNTNTNTFKAMDNISNKKNLKHNFSSSHNNVINIQSSSNFNYYKNRKNKSNQRKNKININKNDSKQKSEAVKLNKNQFSKTENNLCLYINNNFYNKSKNNNSYKKSYLNKNSKSKSNSKIQSESGYSNYVLSSRTPSSIKRNAKKHSMSNLITKEKDEETKIDSFKKDNIYSHYLKTNTSNNLSSLDTNNQNQKNNKENINLETKHQLTEINTYLKVRKCDEIPNQKKSNSNLKIENNKLISSCIMEKEKNEKIISDKPEKLYLSEVLSTENNIKEKPNIKLILIDKKNTNRLLTENNQNFNNKFNSTFNINILQKNNLINAPKNISASKNNLYSNKRKNSSNKDLNKINYGSKTYSQMKNKIDYTKSNLKEKNEDNENINNFNKKHSNNATKNKIFYKPRKNFSVNNSKKQIIKDKKEKDKKINLRYNSFVNVDYNNNNNNKKKDNKINQDLKQDEKKNIQNYNNENILNKEIKFQCPEDLHFFMVNLIHNCRIANSNF